jgi:hypothetical protein
MSDTNSSSETTRHGRRGARVIKRPTDVAPPRVVSDATMIELLAHDINEAHLLLSRVDLIFDRIFLKLREHKAQGV